LPHQQEQEKVCDEKYDCEFVRTVQNGSGETKCLVIRYGVALRSILNRERRTTDRTPRFSCTDNCAAIATNAWTLQSRLAGVGVRQILYMANVMLSLDKSITL
jgi:hypothetical protein